MADDSEFPTELPDDPDRGAGALRWTCGVLAIAALTLAALNAGAIASWAEDLPPAPSTTRVVFAADAWRDTTARLGLDALHARTHRVWQETEAMQWSPALARAVRQGATRARGSAIRTVATDRADRRAS